MKILVTGGAGFIGSHLIDLLLCQKNKVVAIDDLSLGRKENISHNLGNKNFSFYKENLLNEKKLRSIFQKEKFDVIFHFAANSDISSSWGEPNIDFENTFLSTYIILKMMKHMNVKQIIFPSTSAIYGETDQPIDEDYGPLFPVSHYGAAKMASEAFISSFVHNYGFQAWIIRFPNVVGERATHGVIFDFIKKLKMNHEQLEVLGNGKQKKPYLYVEDLIEAIIFIWKNSNHNINYFNVGADSQTTVDKIAKVVIEKMELNAGINYTGGSKGWIGDVAKFSYKLDKIHKLGWSAKYSSDQSVKIAIEKILDKK